MQYGVIKTIEFASVRPPDINSGHKEITITPDANGNFGDAGSRM